MKPSPKKRRKTSISPSMRALLETSKHESRLLGDVQRLLLGRAEAESTRDQTVLHPSSVAKAGWCQRAGYYQLVGRSPVKKPFSSWQMEMIFDEGHFIHERWQSRFWEIEALWGVFRCMQCKHYWYALAPSTCASCGAPREYLRYAEVPLVRPDHLLSGHADGYTEEPAIIEIKSVGLGTLRFENPSLLAKHTYRFTLNGAPREFVDLDALWKDISQPFPAHIRQAHLYSFISETASNVPFASTEIFIYECKWNQRAKEFVVRYDQDRIQHLLDACQRIRQALEEDVPPPCLHKPGEGCEECRAYESDSGGGEPPQADYSRFRSRLRSHGAGGARRGQEGFRNRTA